MTKRATRGKPPRRGSASAPRKAARRPNRPGMLDQAIAAIPVSDATLRKIATWSILGVAGAITLGIATWFGIPGAMGVALAEGVGRAGFRVKEIEITGIERMDKMTVYGVALDQKSRAMPLVDLNQVRDQLLALSWVADARVSRRLPNTLAIDIVERKPAAIWQVHEQLMLVDASGEPLEPVNAEAMPDLPLLVGDNANAQEPGYRALVDAAPALKPLIKAATWIGNRRWNLTFNTGEKLLLPEGDEVAIGALVKFAELDGTQRLLGRGYLQFDMRDPSKLVTRTATSASVASMPAPGVTAAAAPVTNTVEAQ